MLGGCVTYVRKCAVYAWRLRQRIVRLMSAASGESGAPFGAELALLFSLLLILELLYPGTMRLGAISPSPFWIPVLLLSVQYGVSAGLISALVALVASAVIGWPDQAGTEDFYDYSLRIWREPILWLAAAVVLGTLQAQQLRKIEALRDRIAEAEVQRQSIAESYFGLKAHFEDLQRYIACKSDRSIEAGLAAFAAVRNASPDNFGKPLAAAVELLFGPATYVVLHACDRLSRGQHNGRADCGSGDLGNADAFDELPAALLDSVMLGGRFLSILREQDIELLAKAALFAAPITASDSARVLGGFVIKEMPSRLISADVETSVRALCRELGAALIKGREFETTARADDVEATELSKSGFCRRKTNTGSNISSLTRLAG